MQTTEKQIAALVKFGIREDLARGATQEQASAWLDELISAAEIPGLSANEAANAINCTPIVLESFEGQHPQHGPAVCRIVQYPGKDCVCFEFRATINGKDGGIERHVSREQADQMMAKMRAQLVG